MTQPTAPPQPEPSPRAADLPGLCAWHAGWALLCAVLVLGFRLAGHPLQGMVGLALLAMVLPGLAGMTLILVRTCATG